MNNFTSVSDKLLLFHWHNWIIFGLLIFMIYEIPLRLHFLNMHSKIVIGESWFKFWRGYLCMKTSIFSKGYWNKTIEINWIYSILVSSFKNIQNERKGEDALLFANRNGISFKWCFKSNLYFFWKQEKNICLIYWNLTWSIFKYILCIQYCEWLHLGFNEIFAKL